MRKEIAGLFFISMFFVLSSCIKHEVIPPPNSTVDLNCSFQGFINGTNAEYTQNVLGYNCYNDNLYYNNPSPTLSNCLYTSEISSFQQTQKIKLTFGPMQWDAGVSSIPTLTMFNDFHSSNSGVQVPLKDIASMTGVNPGVQVEYWDSNGDRWETSTANAAGFVNFITLDQASDNTGDYSLFECTFSVTVFRQDPNQGLLNMTLNNCKFRGWFKR
jgi:hypothetical protein